MSEQEKGPGNFLEKVKVFAFVVIAVSMATVAFDIHVVRTKITWMETQLDLIESSHAALNLELSSISDALHAIDSTLIMK